MPHRSEKQGFINFKRDFYFGENKSQFMIIPKVKYIKIHNQILLDDLIFKTPAKFKEFLKIERNDGVHIDRIKDVEAKINEVISLTDLTFATRSLG